MGVLGRRGWTPALCVCAAVAEVLKRHLVEALLTRWDVRPIGPMLVFECAISALDGTRPCIRTVWIEAADVAYCRHIAAYLAHPSKVSAS